MKKKSIFFKKGDMDFYLKDSLLVCVCLFVVIAVVFCFNNTYYTFSLSTLDNVNPVPPTHPIFKKKVILCVSNDNNNNNNNSNNNNNNSKDDMNLYLNDCTTYYLRIYLTYCR